MTREDALMAMNGATLIGVADKLGVKAACNKTRTALKEAKANVIARILEAEAALAAKEQEAEEKAPATEETSEANEPETRAVETETDETAVETEETKPEAPKQEPASKPKKKERAKKELKEKAPKEKAPVEELAEITEAVNALGDIYDKLNETYFDGLLPKAVIRIKRAAKNYDCCAVRKVDEDYEISVASNAVGRPIEETAAAVLHAMVHLYCQETGIVETCQKGRYHNAKFRKECEDRDLIVEHDTANGYVFTTPSEAFTSKISKAGIDLDMELTEIPVKNAKKNAERA